MYARRFLGCVFVLTLVVVAAAFSMYQWGGRLLLEQAVPHGHFRAEQAGDAPDYAQMSSWLARPGKADDPSQWLPLGASRAKVGRAAVFYIHPTTYLQTDRWNAPLDAGGDTEFRTQLFTESQASAFNAAGEIWAPRYRQAAYGAFLLKSRDAQKALAFAYSDVAAAFDQFIAQAPKDAPIILAGHSQGALHLEHLLREKVSGTPLARRLVAAYVVGWPISTTADLPALGLPACTSAVQTGCILSWMSFGDPPNGDMFFGQWEKTPGFNGAPRRRRNVLCVNPITGVKDTAAPPSDNPGTLIPSANLQTASLAPGRVGGHCHAGLLIIDGDIPAFPVPPIFGNNFHVYDYALFWGAIRRDVGRRLAAWHP